MRIVEQLRHDRSVLDVILCGSLSHGTVWAPSDIDLVLVTIDDAKVQAGDVALNTDGDNACALPFLYNVRKWLTRRGDLDCTSLWLLYAATPLAQVEMLAAQLASRLIPARRP